jgi:DNA polymerase-3 subunit epsilon
VYLKFCCSLAFIHTSAVQLHVLGPQRFNPGFPMSAEVIAIHGIRDADVAQCPRFEEAAAEWQQFLQGCDLHGYNAKKFDVPILR